jgi:CheY-like chemotaxis protein
MKSSKTDDQALAARANGAAQDRVFEAMLHEIRRPLDGAIAVGDLLQREVLPEGAASIVRTLVEQHALLLRMLTEASDLSRARAGVLELDPKPVELRAFMDEIQEAWATPARENGATLSVSYDGADVSAVVDGARLRQVFDSLIERALHLTRRGGVEASLTARRSEAGLVLEGRVRDSGAALTPDRLARIFEPASGAAGEAGLGLPLSRHIVEAMHGAIVAENNAGAGATIAFNLVAEEAVLDLGETEQPQAARSAHVLVVDDNATNRMVAEALCEMFECTSESVEDGIEAVEAAGSGRFDLILMDIKMPRMDGVEATKRIRAMPGVCGVVPIIALTANADPEDAEAYIAAGMSAVVEKPIKPEALLNAMNACLPGASETGGHAAAA